MVPPPLCLVLPFVSLAPTKRRIKKLPACLLLCVRLLGSHSAVHWSCSWQQTVMGWRRGEDPLKDAKTMLARAVTEAAVAAAEAAEEAEGGLGLGLFGGDDDEWGQEEEPEEELHQAFGEPAAGEDGDGLPGRTTLSRLIHALIPS